MSMKIKMYSAAVHIDELFTVMVKDPESLHAILKGAGTKAVYQDNATGLNHFLYLHPNQRDRTYRVLRKHFTSAVSVKTPAYVNADDLAHGTGNEDSAAKTQQDEK